MTPINEVSVGKFCRFCYSVVYLYKNDFKDTYGVIPIVGDVPTDKLFNHKVFIYKRPKKDWINKATEWLNEIYKTYKGQKVMNGIVVENAIRIDNLTYIENLAILKSYGI